MRVLRRPARCGLLILAFVIAGAPELSAQPQGPIKLFPDVDEGAPPERPLPVRPDRPADGARAPDARPRPGSPAFEAPGQPSPEGGVRVEGLEAPEVDAIGLTDGLDPAVWQAADPERVVRLIGRLPVAHQNRPLQELTQRLLVTGALFGDAPAPGAMLIARVRGLVAIGALDDAAALLDQLPRQDVDSPLTRASAEVALWRGDPDTACRLAEALALVADAPFWGELMVFCRGRAGDPDGAALALDLLREAGRSDDPRFLALAEGRDAVAGDAPWTALHVAMLEAAGRPLPAGVADEASGPLLEALAARPDLAPERTLEVGERAFMRGTSDRDRLAAAYRAGAPENPADPHRVPEDLPLPEARARAFAVLEAGAEPGEAARIFDRLWARTPAEERELTGAVFAPLLNELPALEELLFAAPAFARALLVAGYPGPASRWLDLLQKHAADDVTAREAAAALAPLLAIGGSPDTVPRFGREAFEAWRASRPEDAPAPARLLALLEGAGARVPLDLWWLVEERGDGQPAPGVIWRILERARASGATGETILAGLHLLSGEPAAADREALIQGLAAFREAGLAEEARRIAVVAAVRSGL